MALELLLLGTGGPFANPRRASSGAVVLVDGEPRILVDAGGGAFERLGRAGVDPAALELVLLTHMHADDAGGLAAVVFGAYIGGRTEPLRLAGPAGRDGKPGVARFAELLFGERGAFSYLHGFEGFRIETIELASDVDPARESEVAAEPAAVRAVGVRHGGMPSVAYRIEHGGASLVLSGDVERADAGLQALARGCDVLVHDCALPEREVEHGELHAKPSAVGETAAAAGARTLVLTHFMPEIEDELDAAVAHVRRSYGGEVVLGEDLLWIPVG